MIPDDFGLLRLPAHCDGCGHVFPSGFAVGDSATSYMEDCASGPCPRCGGTGLVPNGAYTIVERLLTFDRNADMTREDIAAAISRLSSAVGPGSTVDLELLERALPGEAPTVAKWVLTVLRDPAWEGVNGIGTIKDVALLLIVVLAFFGRHL